MAVGLQTWAPTARTPIALWDLAASACAIGRGGERPTLRRFHQLENHCRNWAALWADAVERFDPDVVVVRTGPLDLVDRRLDGWDRARSPGDPVFDAWLLGEMQAAADVLSHRGARLIWLTSPCVAEAGARAPLAESGALDPARIKHLDSVILPSLWKSRAPELRLFDLYGVSCPKGRFSARSPGRERGSARTTCITRPPAPPGSPSTWVRSCSPARTSVASARANARARRLSQRRPLGISRRG
jgi:hypothetical protein